jgi:hypothetical protein
VAVESAAGHGGRMDGKTLIGRLLHTEPEEEEEEEEERKKKKENKIMRYVRQREVASSSGAAEAAKIDRWKGRITYVR